MADDSKVVRPGWNRVTFPGGRYPTNLFVVADSLYGILSSPDGTASLWQCKDGAGDWQPVPEPAGIAEENKFPQHMASSPGVSFDKKLWLIGGSTVDPTKASGEVWCYEEATGLWRPKNAFPPLLSARMGHACVVWNGHILVLGGWDGGASLNDVWQLDGDTWTKVGNAPPSWSPRCMCAAVGQRTGGKERLWIYGGGEDPTDLERKCDLWWTEDGKTWSPQTFEKGAPIVPEPGVPLGAALLAYPVSRAGPDRLHLIGSFRDGNRVSSLMFELHPNLKTWETVPVIGAWEQFGGLCYYMQSVAFNRSIHVWSLHADTAATRLNVFFPG